MKPGRVRAGLERAVERLSRLGAGWAARQVAVGALLGVLDCFTLEDLWRAVESYRNGGVRPRELLEEQLGVDVLNRLRGVALRFRHVLERLTFEEVLQTLLDSADPPALEKLSVLANSRGGLGLLKDFYDSVMSILLEAGEDGGL